MIGAEPLQSREEIPRGVSADSTQDRLTVLAKIRADERQQLNKGLVRDLAGKLRS